MKKALRDLIQQEIEDFEKKNGKDLAYKFNGKKYFKKDIR